jgi:poly(hydroxyalkanoate) depolymerase family esterase
MMLLACATTNRVVPRSATTVRGSSVTPAGIREYVAYRPASFPDRRGRRALVVMLHGCTQTADDFARGTRMNAEADANGFLVLYPQQSATAHPQKCWNWYTPEQYARGKGEASLLAAMIDSVATAEGVTASRIAVVGMSAGAAMAANLAVAYPERFSALALHSGVAALAATDLASALRAMRQADGDGAALGAAGLEAMGARRRSIRVLVLHGAEDKVVSPKNLGVTARQWTVVNAATGGVPPEIVSLPGVGHAWSGGAAEGSYTEPKGQDATRMIVAFLRRAGVID